MSPVARFVTLAEVSYLVTMVLAVVVPSALGALAARRAEGWIGLSNRRLAIAILSAFVSWIILVLAARTYSETDHPGWQAAEWLAHTGKWHLFVAGFCFTTMLTLGREGCRAEARSRILLGLLAAGVIAVAVHRTFPVFILLGEGTRDGKGYLRQSERHEYTCAAVALANYLERHQGHRRVTEREAAEWCGTTVEGTTKSEVLQAARRCGLSKSACRKLAFAELTPGTLPAIVSVSTLPQVRHATLLVKVDADYAYFIDPAYGEWKTTVPRFKKVWYGTTITFN